MPPGETLKTPEQELKSLLCKSALGCQRVVKLVGLEACYLDRYGRPRLAYLACEGEELKVDCTVPGFPA